MALTFKDRVLETSVSTGTGDFICGGAQTGYQPFSTVGDGATVTYTIQSKNLDGTLTGDWEVGVGTYHLSGNYISRDTVLESSNGDALVYFPAGDKDIFLDLPGERIVQSPTIAVNGNFVSYDGVTGQVIKDSGSKASDFATAAQGAKADTAVQQSVVGQPNGVASLDSTGKVPTSQIPQMGDLNYQGTWNASTNTPTLTSSVGTKGYYYVVSVAGTTNLNGITDWAVGDWAVFNGSVWQKIDNTDAVTSVNGYTGTVVLTQPDIAGTVPTSRTISTGTGLIGGGDLSANRTISFSTASVGTWAANPTSANLSAAMTDETGSGLLVFGTNPTLANPNIDVIDFDTTYATTLTAGQLGWDGNNTLGLGMAGGNVVQHVGEDSFIYTKASSAITKGQVIMFTGAVGASGVPTGAPATGVTDGTYIMGIAAESIANNGFGLVQTFGTLRNVNTTGYADGDILWYNPAVTGGLTKTTPSAPNVKVQMAAVLNGGSAGGGSILIRVSSGSALGGTDSNVQITTPSNGQILSYDGGNSYWKNTSLTAGTAISVSSSANGVLTVANTAPDQVVSLTGAGTTTVTGTYPNFTITSNDQYTGTVTSVTGTAPISVATGTTTPVVSMTQANSTTNGWLSSTDWNTFNSKGSGSVTSVSGTGSVNGITLTGTVTSSGSLTLGGTLSGIGNSQLTNSSVTVNGTTIALGASGTITAATPNALSAGTGLSYTTGTTFDGSAARTLNLANTAVTAGSYTYASITVDAQGRLTSASSGTAPITSVSGTANQITASTVAGATTLSTPSTFIAPGSIAATTTVSGTILTATNGLVVNSNTISASYSIPSGSNAMSTGPISIASGQSVTVPSGSKWVVI